MGWQGYHLHMFDLEGVRYGPLDPDFPSENDWVDEKSATLGQVALAKDFSFIYRYDFGDNWHHEVVVEDITAPEPREKMPNCVGGERACPPEDCGGIWGYQDFLEAYLNPGHEEHVNMVEWAGLDFDAERFDLKRVNQALKRTRRGSAGP